MKITTRAITLAATLSALCAVTGFLPGVFFLPVMVAATTLSIGMVAFVGLAFGCISLAYSYMMPTSVVAVAFIEAPYLAILPRILAAIATFAVFKLSQKLFKPKGRGGRFATVSLSAALGSLFNTAFVVSLMVLIVPNVGFGGETVMTYVPVMLINAAIECPCMAVLTPPISLTLDKVVLHKTVGNDKAACYANANANIPIPAENNSTDSENASDASATSETAQPAVNDQASDIQ